MIEQTFKPTFKMTIAGDIGGVILVVRHQVLCEKITSKKKRYVWFVRRLGLIAPFWYIE